MKKILKIVLRLLIILLIFPYMVLFGLLIPTLGLIEIVIRNKVDGLDWIHKQTNKITKYAFDY